MISYYFYRLFPNDENGEFSIYNSHLFDASDLLKRIDAYDTMKPISDLHLTPTHSLY